MQFLDSQTFKDHAGEPSFGRKAIFWILVVMGLLAVVALCLVALGPAATGKQVADLTIKLLKEGSTLCALFYGAAQLSKGASQFGSGKAGGLSNPLIPSPPGGLAVPPAPGGLSTPPAGVTPMGPANPAQTTTATVTPPANQQPPAALPTEAPAATTATTTPPTGDQT